LTLLSLLYMSRTISSSPLPFAALILIASSFSAIVPVPPLARIGRQYSSEFRPAELPSATQNLIKSNVSLVKVFVTVLDKKHEVLADLEENDFKIFENSREQKIAVFSKRAKNPITAALLVDTSLSERYLFGVVQEAASGFVHKVLNDGDEAMAMSFDSKANVFADFTENFTGLDRLIHQTAVKPPVGRAGTVFYDAVYLACRQLIDEAGKKLLVVFTDAYDTGSRMNLRDDVAEAQRTNATIYIFLIADPRFSSGYGFGSRGEVVAKIMTSETGGRTIEIRKRANLAEGLDELSEEIRSQYVVGYYPTNAKPDGRFRKIRIKTDVQGTTVLARRGYYAPAD